MKIKLRQVQIARHSVHRISRNIVDVTEVASVQVIAYTYNASNLHLEENLYLSW